MPPQACCNKLNDLIERGVIHYAGCWTLDAVVSYEYTRGENALDSEDVDLNFCPFCGTNFKKNEGD